MNTHQQALCHQFDKLTQLKENYHKQQKEGKRQLNSLERKLLQRQDTGQPYRRCEQQIHRQKLESVEKTTRYQKGRYRCHKDIETRLKKRVKIEVLLSSYRYPEHQQAIEESCRKFA